jgi:MFS family permease
VLQTGADDASRGRVMATGQAAMSGAAIASMLFAGVFGDVLGVRTVFLMAGSIVLAGGALALLLYRGAVANSDATRAATATIEDERTAGRATA